MGYKIFYSYQSDIKKKLNQIFIREAINAAIVKITEFNIDPLIEGFYGLGGNPPLAESMLKQSKDSDIFIGDITFTSSKIWQSQGVNFLEDSKTYLIEIEKPFNLKPAPNPNVLLEIGYSWALKSFNRSILVMNEAFGHPSLLPVDMVNLRWPITYNLSEERHSLSSKYNKEFENLTIALEGAIREAINSNIEYQSELLSPLQTYSSWARIYTTPFILKSKTKKIITDLRCLISKNDKSIRIIAPSKSGLSRLLFELFRKNHDLEENIANLNKLVYYDYDGILEGNISEKIDIIRIQNLDKILILDNCPQDKLEKIEEFFLDTKVKLISTTNKSQQARNEYIISKSDVLDISIEILETKFSYSTAVELATKLKSNIKMVIHNLNDNVSLEGQTSSLELIKQEIGEGNIKKGALELLTNISIFRFLGIHSVYTHELSCFLDAFYPGTELVEFDAIMKILIEIGLIIRKGDFIQVIVDDEELIYDWWKELNSQKIEQIQKIDNSRLLNKLTDQLINTHKNLAIPGLEHNLFGSDKFLRKNDYYLTSQGQKFLNCITQIFPEKVLKISEEIVQNLLK